MKSGTSCCECGGWFSTALLRKNIARFSPIWGIYTLILFIIMPMPMFMSYLGGYGNSRFYLTSFLQASIFFGLLYGVIMAMGLFSYLMNPRSAHLLHSLPIRREGLFFTNWVSGALFIAVPNLLIALLSAVAMVLSGDGAMLGALGEWLVIICAVELFFFAMAVFCGMFTGNLLAMPVFYGILNLLAMGVYFLIGTSVELLTVGISMDLDFGTTRFLTPVYFLMDQVSSSSVESMAALLAYSLIGCAIFSLLALAIYRLRQLERAGDLITVGWMRPVFQTCMGLGLGMLVGWFTYVGFFQDQGYREWLFILLAVFWTVFFTVSARMLLKKTLRVWKTGWKGFVLTGLAMALLLVGVKLDLPGRQRYVPQADAVDRIGLQIYGNFSYYLDLDDPEQIEEVTEIHQAITQRLDLVRKGSESYASYEEYTEGENNYQTSCDTRLRISYLMKDGSLLERYYNLIVRAEDLTDPASAASKLEAFLDRPDMAFERHFEGMSREELENSTVVEATVSRVAGDDGEVYYLEAVEAQRLMKAMAEDLAAGRVRVSLLWDRDAQENELFRAEFYVAQKPKAEGRQESGEAVTEAVARYYDVPIQRSCTSALAALAEMGCWNEE